MPKIWRNLMKTHRKNVNTSIRSCPFMGAIPKSGPFSVPMILKVIQKHLFCTYVPGCNSNISIKFKSFILNIPKYNSNYRSRLVYRQSYIKALTKFGLRILWNFELWTSTTKST